jgi:hypothetical protein
MVLKGKDHGEKEEIMDPFKKLVDKIRIDGRGGHLAIMYFGLLLSLTSTI